MTTSAALQILLLCSRPAAAHDYPIAPVNVILRVEPDRVVADVDSDSIYWIEEVAGLHPMPPKNWPADALASVEKYADEHLRLTADGRPLAGTLVFAEYVQRPWQVNEQGRFHLRLAYPSVAGAATLGGEADFFEDYRRERLDGKDPILPSQDFRTLLTVAGHRFELKPYAVSFSVSAMEARSGAFRRFTNCIVAGALTALMMTAGWPALAALCLSLAPGVPSPRRTAALFVALLVGAASWPGTPSAWLSWAPWAAGVLAALAAGRWLGAAASPPLEAAAMATLGRAWMVAALPGLSRATPGPVERGAAAIGLLAAALVLAAGLLAVNAGRRRLTLISESRAGELFERRRRLAATALLIACGCGLFSGLPG